MAIGDNIRTARINKGLNQKELAELVSKSGEEIGNTTISNWEKGISKPDPDMIGILCTLLDVDANFLLDFKTKDNSEYDLINQYQMLFDKDDTLTGEQKKFFMDFLEEKHSAINKEKEEKGS